MEKNSHKRPSAGCLTVVSEHPFLLAVNAASLLLLCIYSLFAGADTSVFPDAIVSAGFLKAWLTSLLMLAGILLTGIFPGFLAELVALIVLGGRLMAPILSIICTDSGSCMAIGTLFLQILTLLLTGTLAGSISMQAAHYWARSLILWLDPYQENEAFDLNSLPPPDLKASVRELLFCFFRAVIPLSALVAWTVGWTLAM